jgi:hypothetical protein
MTDTTDFDLVMASETLRVTERRQALGMGNELSLEP